MNVILLMVMTMDGKIARSSMELVDWTGKEDKKYFVQITKDAGAMIMGSKTFDTFGYPLPDRKNIVMTRNKKRKSLDNNLIFTDNSPQKILQDLRQYIETRRTAGHRVPGHGIRETGRGVPEPSGGP